MRASQEPECRTKPLSAVEIMPRVKVHDIAQSARLRSAIAQADS
jgi:hypothetical protein